jgi:hypothetical protein
MRHFRGPKGADRVIYKCDSSDCQFFVALGDAEESGPLIPNFYKYAPVI